MHILRMGPSCECCSNCSGTCAWGYPCYPRNQLWIFVVVVTSQLADNPVPQSHSIIFIFRPWLGHTVTGWVPWNSWRLGSRCIREDSYDEHLWMGRQIDRIGEELLWSFNRGLSQSDWGIWSWHNSRLSSCPGPFCPCIGQSLISECKLGGGSPLQLMYSLSFPKGSL